MRTPKKMPSILSFVLGSLLATSCTAEVAQMPLDASFCTILRAFTEKPDARCPHPTDMGPTRSTGNAATAGFPRGAAPLKTAGGSSGYFIRFAFNSVELNKEYMEHLDRLSSVFQSAAMKGVCIKLLGHTDIVGDDEYNKRLSVARAKMVESYLVTRATIDKKHIQAFGVGERKPLSNIPGGHPLNRRVEILAKSQVNGGCNS